LQKITIASSTLLEEKRIAMEMRHGQQIRNERKAVSSTPTSFHSCIRFFALAKLCCDAKQPIFQGFKRKIGLFCAISRQFQLLFTPQFIKLSLKIKELYKI